MIEIERYNKLKEKYGHVSSWTIWREKGKKAKSNTDGMTIFEDEDICYKLNDKYVFVALNWSGTHGVQEDKPWKNFHSSYSSQNDYRLRYVLCETQFWGSYITDIIKEYPELDSKKVVREIRKGNIKIEDHINKFKEELKILSDERPILIALGNYSFNILQDNLQDEYELYKITHYSHFKNLEDYKKEVLELEEHLGG